MIFHRLILCENIWPAPRKPRQPRKNRQHVSEVFDVMVIIRPLRENKHDHGDGVKIKQIMFRQMFIAPDRPPIIQHDEN